MVGATSVHIGGVYVYVCGLVFTCRTHKYTLALSLSLFLSYLSPNVFLLPSGSSLASDEMKSHSERLCFVLFLFLICTLIHSVSTSSFLISFFK